MVFGLIVYYSMNNQTPTNICYHFTLQLSNNMVIVIIVNYVELLHYYIFIIKQLPHYYSVITEL